jgi:prolyl-tRNA synthetase
MYETYFKIFRKMGLKPIALRADTGAIGGDLSHEFHILADVGESAIFYDKKFDELSEEQEIDIAQTQKIYAMADDLHIPEKCPIPADHLVSRRGIEVGQVFNFGLKYSKAMEASVMGAGGEKIYPNMGSYGIGVSRVVAAAIEANHDEKGIIWPAQISPFDVILINIRVGDEACDKACEELYSKLQNQGFEVLYDDTKNSLGQKFSVADLIGVPKQIIVGPKSLASGKVEVKNRKTGEKSEVSLDEVMLRFLK